MVTSEDVEGYFSFGHETRAFEVKGPGAVGDKAFCAKVARAVMAMANLRDGGLVCLGVDGAKLGAMLPGLSPSDADAWCDHDRVAAAIGRFSDPPPSFHVTRLTLRSGAVVVVIEVREFETTPHICRRAYPGETSEGAVYIRTRGKPQSVPVPSVSEMRELLDLAIAKGLREFVRRADLAGLEVAERVSDRERFDSEVEAAWNESSSLAAAPPGSAYFDVSIRPLPYREDRLEPGTLLNVISAQVVRRRGWPVPMVDHRERVKRYGTWIGQDTSGFNHVEAWRFFSSGQFVQRRVVASDMSDAPQLKPTSVDAVGAIALWDVLLYVVEVSELASRLAGVTGCDRAMITVSIHGAERRELVSGEWNRELHGPYIVDAPTLTATKEVAAADLLADHSVAGLALTQGILQQFGAVIPDRVLSDIWAEVLSR